MSGAYFTASNYPLVRGLGRGLGAIDYGIKGTARFAVQGFLACFLFEIIKLLETQVEPRFKENFPAQAQWIKGQLDGLSARIECVYLGTFQPAVSENETINGPYMTSYWEGVRYEKNRHATQSVVNDVAETVSQATSTGWNFFKVYLPESVIQTVENTSEGARAQITGFAQELQAADQQQLIGAANDSSNLHKSYYAHGRLNVQLIKEWNPANCENARKITAFLIAATIATVVTGGLFLDTIGSAALWTFGHLVAKQMQQDEQGAAATS